MDNLFCDIFSIIDIDKLNSKAEFDEFISNLTNHPTPLREATAYKLEEVYDDKYLDENVLNIILRSITDINPNVSRSVCAVIRNNLKLKAALEEKLIFEINNILNQIPPQKRNNNNNKSHAKNKVYFSLYWLLEALSCCVSGRYDFEIIKILNIAVNFSDYTIREKAAQIAMHISNLPQELINSFKNDNNFYVNFYTNLYKN